MGETFKTYGSFEDALAQSGEYVTLVRGVSMYPMLRYMKDPVLIHPLNGEPRPYDVVVYAKPGRYVIHRLLQVREDCYVIRGDNCNAKEYVPKQDIRGVVVGFWRFGRYIPVTDRWYRAYSRLWVGINPLVRAYHKIMGLGWAIWSRIKGSLKKS